MTQLVMIHGTSCQNQYQSLSEIIIDIERSLTHPHIRVGIGGCLQSTESSNP